ncbi:purine-cytosine permease family protein [Paeniglutamicibacter cryotolerans]|uniref:NCS1 family nucleobase:cation symporter-1 n=1 Tax=Paeniglutamicibacter cryotolerans TaxID=670079 RepID=A0A839QMC2_9MICC|nr:cytosine permease [Paeniglutamicibacter cryotolerans]MBB2995755.1 NCS1 family nucleobase:cation symporter-1 [Paeniglutamicibacter cryotolerans]
MASLLEQNSIGPIPQDERHGRPRDLFFVWFGANMFLITVVTGGLGTTVFGLNFWSTVTAIVAGLLIGGLFMALHAAQGPVLGVPQMIQSRGQFGSRGATVIVIVVIVMYMGWFASNAVVGGQALHSLIPGISVGLGVVLLTATNIVVAVIGYRMVHLVMRAGTIILGGGFLISLVLTLTSGQVSAPVLAQGDFSWAGFFSVLSISALWAVAYAPYVSDYSRYLPAKTGPKPAFWATYAGIGIGSALPMVLGALIGSLIQGDDVVAGLLAVIGPFGIFLLWAAVMFSGLSNAMNLYGATLCSITLVQTFAERFIPRARGRAVIAILLGILAMILGVGGSDNFLVLLVDLIGLMFFVITPWTAINLMDYYVVRRGHYEVDEFFKRDGGIYGRWNKAAMTCYAVGLLVQIPFLASTVYTGPFTEAMSGVDISWLVGLAVTCPLYYLLVRSSSTPKSSIASADRKGAAL